jgi:hypothetical protein
VDTNEDMSDQNSTSSSIVEALQRAAALHAEALRQVEELLRDDALVPDHQALELEIEPE